MTLETAKTRMNTGFRHFGPLLELGKFGVLLSKFV